MKKLLISSSIILVAFVGLLFYSSTAFAFDWPNFGHRDNGRHFNGDFNTDKQLSKSACGKNLGNPVIDVTQKVQNDADSGVAGNYWAFDYYARHVTVWQIATGVESAPNTYCAIVTYDGKFYTVPGQIGPQDIPPGALINTSTNEPVNGDMSGGRRATIVGTLLLTPSWTTHGSVGTTNYQCNITGVCLGAISWPGQYFTGGYTYNDDWWGWQYKGGSHGMWINSSEGNTGNIL